MIYTVTRQRSEKGSYYTLEDANGDFVQDADGNVLKFETAQEAREYIEDNEEPTMTKSESLIKLIEVGGRESTFGSTNWDTIEELGNFITDVLNAEGWAWVENPLHEGSDTWGIIAKKCPQKELEKEINNIEKKCGQSDDDIYQAEYCDSISYIDGAEYFTADWKDIQDLSEQFLKFCKEQNIDLKKYL